VRISLLGPLRVEHEGHRVAFSAAKERSLLTALALSPGSVLASGALIDALWGECPPASAGKTLQTYVSHLRHQLGAAVIGTEAPGYVLRLTADDIDVGRFRELVRQGEQALRQRRTARARVLLGDAVALWRGEPLAGTAADTGLAAEAVRLKEEYLSALEARLTADLAAGAEDDVVSELEALVIEHPFRERLWGHLMLALYRCGRQADALATYQRARTVLIDHLGLQPGGELQRLERAILIQDPTLDLPPPSVRAAEDLHDSQLVRSPVRYARCDDGVNVAYQIVGDGPVDVLAVPGFVSHLDMWWDGPTDHLVRRLSSFSRLILFDKRGMGMSDRPPMIDVEHWVEDAVAVLDAVGSERAVVLGISAGAPTAVLLAATHPHRVQALALYGGYARFLEDDGYEVGMPREAVMAFIDQMEAEWGTEFGLSLLAGSRAEDPRAIEYWIRCQRITASPGAAASFLRALAEIDVRPALPLIDVPTLVIHPARDQNVPVAAARFMAEQIPGAEFVEVDTDIHVIWLSDRVEEITDELEAFLARAVRAPDVESLLATVVAIEGARSRRRDRAIAAFVERGRGRALAAPGRATFPGPAHALRCMLALVSEAGHADDLRVAVHIGDCRLAGDGITGDALDVAEQLVAEAQPGEVLASQAVRDLVVGSPFEFAPRGRRSLRGAPAADDVFAVSPQRSLASR
jgi:DNA-binding SARP family transcriptional activator/pimeloyl-ACP methyl ester carboxylesterase